MCSGRFRASILRVAFLNLSMAVLISSLSPSARQYHADCCLSTCAQMATTFAFLLAQVAYGQVACNSSSTNCHKFGCPPSWQWASWQIRVPPVLAMPRIYDEDPNAGLVWERGLRTATNAEHAMHNFDTSVVFLKYIASLWGWSEHLWMVHCEEILMDRLKWKNVYHDVFSVFSHPICLYWRSGATLKRW